LVHSPYINRLLYREGGIKHFFILLKEVRKNRYDLFIALSHSVESLLLTTFSGAKVKAGFSNFPWDLGLDIKEKVEGHHGWYDHSRLLNRLNVDAEQKDYVGLLILPTEKDPMRSDGSGISQIQGKYVVVSPGTSARRRVKTWEEEKFGDLILRLNEKYAFAPVLVGGEDTIEVNDKIIGIVREKDKGQWIKHVPNLAGKIDLKGLCYILKEASLFVGVDSGIMHLASSFDTPVVGIFGPTDPFYVGPQNRRSVVVREEMECSPCNLKGCEERTCMKRLEVQKVLEACEQLLKRVP